jgi:quercetin dioxygenase-like cupin family protein
MTVIRRNDTTPESIAPGRTRYLAHTDHLMVVAMDFEDGPSAQPDPPHHHPHEQVTYVAKGELYFFIDGEPHRLSAGDLITVPGDVPHSIQLLSKHVRLIDTFTPIRTDFLK